MKNKAKKNKGLRPATKKPLTRKQLRQQQRKQKKQRRNDYYVNRKKPDHAIPIAEGNPVSEVDKCKTPVRKEANKEDALTVKKSLVEEMRIKEMKQIEKLKKKMEKQRKKQLIDENIIEDHNIRRLEKQLKLHKRKSKSIPQSFAADGLDYLLEMSDPQMKRNVAALEEQMCDTAEFEEDIEFMTGQKKNQKRKKASSGNNSNDEEDSKEELEDEIGESLDLIGSSDEEIEFMTGQKKNQKRKKASTANNSDDESDNNGEFEDYSGEDSKEELEDEIEESLDLIGSSDEEIEEDGQEVTEGSEDESEDDYEEKDSYSGDEDDERSKESTCAVDERDIKHEASMKRKGSENDISEDTRSKKQKLSKPSIGDSENDSTSELSDEVSHGEGSDDQGDIWEDIYGRKRRKDGSILDDFKHGKYIPPALRASSDTNDAQRTEKLKKLNKQLKGLINRLAERNMHSISSEIENLYMSNSRNDMNNTITNLILESVISRVNTPERLLMEHILLIVILHANVGTEVGAYFLQIVVKKFDTLLKEDLPVENKELDNVVSVLSYLYDFRLFDSKLLYQIIDTLSEKFEEKQVECILHILKNVGFSLRKDDSLALKDLIMKLHEKARDVPEEMQDNARVKFMLEILLAIKNNNVRKIPNYDTSYSEHLKKLLKGFIRKGNYVTQLNISLEDLLNAEEKGKWWVVGSAWTGKTVETQVPETKQAEGFSQKILKQAKKHRMNTDTRRNIFCIIMSAEDYLDAFQKLLRLGLKNQQEREIIDIILYCQLHEKEYNPYYTILVRQFCTSDRKYQMMVKYAVWDKLKVIGDLSPYRLSNLAKLLIHLFINKAMSISILKIIEFGELDKVTMRFIRQVLLGILLHEDEEEVKSVFENVAKAEQLKMFKEKINLFIHHFLLRNLGDNLINSNQKLFLERRAHMIEQILMYKNKYDF